MILWSGDVIASRLGCSKQGWVSEETMDLQARLYDKG